jgi:prophage maintenance system killer protein
VNGVHAAAYTIRIIRHHPLFDGNQRDGFVVGALFLEINATISSPARKRRRRPR